MPSNSLAERGKGRRLRISSSRTTTGVILNESVLHFLKLVPWWLVVNQLLLVQLSANFINYVAKRRKLRQFKMFYYRAYHVVMPPPPSTATGLEEIWRSLSWSLIEIHIWKCEGLREHHFLDTGVTNDHLHLLSTEEEGTRIERFIQQSSA